jgi:hypothetical protein
MYNVEVLVFSIWWFSSVCGIANNILSFHWHFLRVLWKFPPIMRLS